MTTRRVIQFETSTNDGVVRVRKALARAFDVRAEQRPAGVGLAYWQVQGSRRFVVLTDLADEQADPLLQVDAARAPTGVIGDRVPGGYPTPTVVEQLGAYGSLRRLPDSRSGPHGS